MGNVKDLQIGIEHGRDSHHNVRILISKNVGVARLLELLDKPFRYQGPFRFYLAGLQREYIEAVRRILGTCPIDQAVFRPSAILHPIGIQKIREGLGTSRNRMDQG